MDLSADLSPIFVAQATANGGTPAASPELESALAAALDAGRAAWPEITVAPEAFVRHLADKAWDESDVVQSLRALHAADLYVACACACGDARALEAFESQLADQVRSYLGQLESRRDEIEEVKQDLRARLLVPESHGRTKIADYGGRGPLRSWLRRATAHVLYDRRRARVSEGPLVPDAASLPSTAPDPEILYLRVRYGRELDIAFREAVASLSKRDATLLQLYFVNGMTAPALATMYKAGERTVRRWLSDARGHILDETRRRLAERLEISNTECLSLVAMLQSQLDLSVQKLMREKGKR